MTDLVPREEFDEWAETYDSSVSINQFPFDGYQVVLSKVVEMAEVRAGMSVLDLGTGTGNLAERFAHLGCELWCTDFSPAMLAKARLKLPQAHFLLHDLREELPAGIPDAFDRIVSAYVFHHFELDEKVRILRRLLPHLAPGGRLIIGDIAFRDQTALEQVKAEAGAEWEQEYYWLAEDALPALEEAGLAARYMQVSACAAIFVISILPAD
jgi:putative AdoMet-dependent methyltransferase